MGAPKDETYSEEETKRRAEATLKVMLATPHRPHKPTGLTPSKTKMPKPPLTPKRPNKSNDPLGVKRIVRTKLK